MRGTGYIPDVFDIRDLQHTEHPQLVGASSFPASVSLADYLPAVVDQFNTNSCVGHALATAIYATARVAGTQLPNISALAIYAGARAADYAKSPKLPDIGCRPRAAAEWIKKRGIVAEGRWPFLSSKAEAWPPLDVYQAGADAVLGGYYRVTGRGQALEDNLRLCLAQGCVVAFAQPVYDDFERYTAGSYLGSPPTGTTRGSHMTALYGYAQMAEDAGKGTTSKLVFQGINSWGLGWGDAGHYTMTSERLLATGSDFYTFHTIPKVIR